MKAYLVITGLVFLLITLAHVARVVVEGAHLLRDPFFVATTLLTIGMSAWAARLLARGSRAP